MRDLILILLIISIPNFVSAQDIKSTSQDTTSLVVDTAYKHSPKRATLMSAVIPGAGQFYNQKYWKIPVIYVAGGALVYSTIQNNNGYQEFLEAYTVFAETEVPMEGYEVYELDQLKSVKDQYRRYRDLSIVGLILLYTLNIVDATVDGYLFDYDVGDDLSLRIEPSIMNNYYQSNTFKASNQFGLKCTINF